MKDYTVKNPAFTETIQITETTDTNHADNINAAPKQIFENTMANKKSIDQINNQLNGITFSINKDDGGLDITIN